MKKIVLIMGMILLFGAVQAQRVIVKSIQVEDTLFVEYDSVYFVGVGDSLKIVGEVFLNGTRLTATATELNYLDDPTAADGVLRLLTDTRTVALFGAGAGAAGDTALIDASYNAYGYFRMDEDSLEVTKIITNVSTGDTVNYSVVYNDSLWTTAGCDTIVTIPAGAGETITTVFTIDTVPEDNYIWVEMDAVVAGSKPIKFRVELVGYIKRD